MKVKIPFKPRFKEPMLNGQKTWTSRNKWYGQIWDTFDAFGEEFVITNRARLSLGYVADHSKEEGCKSREDFIELWKQIHPRRGFLTEQIVKVHQFKKVGGALT